MAYMKKDLAFERKYSKIEVYETDDLLSGIPLDSHTSGQFLYALGAL